MDLKTIDIVSFEVEADNIKEFLKLADKTQRIFKKQKGFISSRLLIGSDKKSIIQIIEWESSEDGMNCMISPDWKEQEGQDFMNFINSGKATMKVNNYRESN